MPLSNVSGWRSTGTRTPWLWFGFCAVRGPCLVLLASGALVAAQEPPDGGARKLPEIEKDLRQAVAANQMDRAGNILDELARTENPQAIDIIIKQALGCTNSWLERRAETILCGIKKPELRGKILESFEKSTNQKTRIGLLSVAARISDDPRALAAIHAGLKDPAKAVALAAIFHIRALRKKESLEPLIAELEARERKPLDRVYFDIRRTLKEIAQAELDAAVDWRNYLNARKQGLPPPPKGKKGGRTTLFKGSSFFTVMLDSDRVLFVIDISESMLVRDPLEGPQKEEEKNKGTTVVAKRPGTTTPGQGSGQGGKSSQPPPNRERLARVREELIRSINDLPPNARFGVIAFSHEITPLWEGRALKEATSENRQAAVKWVRALRANGATRTDLALQEALSTPDVDTILLLTDGAPRDEKNQRLPIEPILAQVAEANRFVRARIKTISFKQIKDKNMVALVRSLAAQNDGGEPMLLP